MWIIISSLQPNLYTYLNFVIIRLTLLLDKAEINTLGARFISEFLACMLTYL